MSLSFKQFFAFIFADPHLVDFLMCLLFCYLAAATAKDKDPCSIPRIHMHAERLVNKVLKRETRV